MPGSRRGDEKKVLIQIRLTEKEAERWKAHVTKHGGYVSALVREIVNEHVDHAQLRERCSHWD